MPQIRVCFKPWLAGIIIEYLYIKSGSGARVASDIQKRNMSVTTSVFIYFFIEMKINADRELEITEQRFPCSKPAGVMCQAALSIKMSPDKEHV